MMARNTKSKKNICVSFRDLAFLAEEGNKKFDSGSPEDNEKSEKNTWFN